MSSAEDFSKGPSKDISDKIVLIVGGVIHETYKSTLMTVTGSRLAKLVDIETPPKEVCFDRHPEIFTHILHYYRSGKLHCPTNLCGVLLEEEFDFWGISVADVEPCCWVAFQKHRDAMETLAQIDPSVMDQRNRSKLWVLFDDPLSSVTAKVIAVTSLIFILLSIIAFTLNTNEHINPEILHNQTLAHNTSWTEEMIHYRKNSRVFGAIELVCSIWFILEFLIRVICCPSKCRFFMNLLNIVDLLALFPMLFHLCLGELCVKVLGFLHVMRCIRLLRVFKLMQHMYGVKVLIHTLHASAAALCAVPVALFCCTIIFGTMIYYTELDEYHGYFQDIPSSFWWAVVTLTTVGYGDMLPISVPGRFVAALCATVGVFIIVLPVPIIVNNFLMFYSLVKAKTAIPKMKSSNVDPSYSRISA
nr:potassium voltage-gated channel subfamily C member 3-like [Misgurnus anguillicaudatus]XP_055038177.1 potassium voltage-gated channel subfamily C member 3-like [Misgurnus anguillicaudatus]